MGFNEPPTRLMSKAEIIDFINSQPIDVIFECNALDMQIPVFDTTVQGLCAHTKEVQKAVLDIRIHMRLESLNSSLKFIGDKDALIYDEHKHEYY